MPSTPDEPSMALSPGPGSRRDVMRGELARAPYDLLVVGGGIIGAGIANEASRAGLRVALVDRGDFGGATSSASSKLIHGGLRYLRLGDIKLVREAHTERRALLRVVAPHLVRRIPFLFPVYRGGPYRPATIQAGLWSYSTLARERPRRLVGYEQARLRVPPLRAEGLRGCGVYEDAWTHDGRLCLANVTAASEAGATVLNYAEVVELRLVARQGQGRRDPRSHLRRGRVRRGTRRRQRDGTVARHAATPGRPRRRAVRPAVEGRPRHAPARRAVVGGADDPPRPGARDVRVPVGGHASPRHDGHAVRRRSCGGHSDRGRHRPRAGRGGGRARSASLSRERVLSTYAGLRVLPRRGRLDRRRTPRDRVPAGQGRDADGGGRQADDVSPDRSRRSRANQGGARARRPRPPPGPPPRRNRSGQRRCPARHAAGRSSPRSRPISRTSTARGRTGCSRPRPSVPSCSSESTPARPTWRHRSSSRPARSGRRAPRTSCTAERRSPHGGSWAGGHVAGRRDSRSLRLRSDRKRPARSITYARALSDWIEAHTRMKEI